jgi:hypothetical protein
MAELEHCLLQLQQSNDVNLMESVRSAVMENLKQVEQHRDSLLARLAGIASYYKIGVVSIVRSTGDM